ncbi:type II secretion system F family protein [Anaerotardibacter muris]|uniref:type II secretion system F family protein n=1 Tax=Anaerotardibacter muris TaxID=2941505 RepID=UPI00204228CA|nr:type II secretion system F family protein [Anaerotardibacter muris]
METAMIILGITNASIAGTALGYWGLAKHEEQRIARAYRLQAGADQHTRIDQRILEVRGVYRSVLLQAIKNSLPADEARKPVGKFWLLRADALTEMLPKAGLAGSVNLEGCGRTRRNLALGGALGGLAIGALFSEMLAGILCVAGFILGFQALHAALKQEIEARASVVEQELSQLIEVLVLGLRSGLSFDRSLEFYCQYFSGGLSRLCALLQTQWNHGLITREEGLRTLAESYDSSLLERIMESIIRALRFGTSLAETLSNAGAEIRATRKTKLEERVAKAPVKMLIPIGTLILPAMLILILGPVLLELISGF